MSTNPRYDMLEGYTPDSGIRNIAPQPTIEDRLRCLELRIEQLSKRADGLRWSIVALATGAILLALGLLGVTVLAWGAL